MSRRRRSSLFLSLAHSAYLAVALLSVGITGCGGNGSSSGSTTTNPSNPIPSITSVSPTSATAGASAFTLTVNGSSFVSGATVDWNGSPRQTTFVSASQLTASITAADIASASSEAITVVNPAPGGGASSSFAFAVNPPAPTVNISVKPTAITLSSSALLTWSSTNATSCTASGAWTGTQPTSGTLSVTPTTAGTPTYTLTCTNAGGSTAASATLTVNQPVPTVNLSFSAASVTLGSSSTLTWSSTNATSCTASGAWTGTLATSGTQTFTPTTASLSIPGYLTYTLNCAGVAGGSATANATLTVTYPTPTGRLAKIRSFEYMLASHVDQSGVNADIANSLADLIITQGIYPLNRTLADPTDTKLIIGYVDTSEASSYLEPALFSGGPLPSWFGNQTPGYTGLYSVQYWNPAWEPYIFGIIDQTVANGYDGIFLDVLDGDNEWSAGNAQGNPVYANATTAMETLVSDIRNYVNTKYAGKNFYLVGNNPTGIARANITSVKALDAVFNEWVYYGQSPTNGAVSVYEGNTEANAITATLAPLYATLGIPILGNDYPNPLSSTSADLLSFNFYSALGWVPSVTAPTQTAGIFATGPFMFMATPTNSTVTGYPGFTNFLSGGTTTNATLVGGNQGDYFIGGPGQNTITGGSGNDTIYAHPANAAEKNQLIVDLAASIQGNGTTPSVAIEVNGTQVVAPTPITAVYQTSNQRLQADLSSYSSITSVQILVTNTSYSSQSNYSNIQLIDVIYNGVPINLSLGQYPNGGAPPYPYSNNGTVTFPGTALAVVSPFPSNTSDVINGGGGTNTVVYRGPASNYTVTQQTSTSWSVTSAATAEGPDTLTNVQVLQFSDKQMTLP